MPTRATIYNNLLLGYKMLEHTNLLTEHLSHEIETLCDAELGTVVYVCTDDYVCNVTGDEFYLRASGKTKNDAISNCYPPTFDESIKHIVNNDITYSIDFDRLREAMKTESFTMPPGLSREEKREYIKACADGKIIAE